MFDTTVSSGSITSDDAYQYDTFTTRLILSDMAFRRSDPAAGDQVPSFELEVIGGGRFASSSLGPKPVLMVFGSMTCPVTESSAPVLRDLYGSFGDRVRFVVVNTREAHPGELIPQPKTNAEKREHAMALRARHNFAFEVAVDDIDGAFHRAMGPKPNSAYLLSAEGVILFRGHWANDRSALKAALESVAAGRRPLRPKSSSMVWPLLKAIGYLPGVVKIGGKKVARDVWRAAAPFGVMAALSKLFGVFPKDLRGPAAMLGLAAAGVTAWLLMA